MSLLKQLKTKSMEDDGIIPYVSGSVVLFHKGKSSNLGNRDLQKAIRTAGLFEKILIYRGPFFKWTLNPDGGIFVLATDKLWYENNSSSPWLLAPGVKNWLPPLRTEFHLYEENKKIFLGRKTLLFDEPYNEWAPNLKGGGIIVRQGESFYLVVF